MPPKTERFEFRLDEDILSRVDNWRKEQEDLPTRAEAMRRLVEAGLARTSSDVIRFNDGDKVIISMLCDIQRNLKMEEDTQVDLIDAAIHGGHYWSLGWELSSLFEAKEDDPQNVEFTVSVMSMWSELENSYKRLSKADKALVGEANPFPKKLLQFPGFDGNREPELFSIMRFVINKLGRFSLFKDRECNTFRPMSPTYERMLSVYEPMLKTIVGTELEVAQIIAILKAA